MKKRKNVFIHMAILLILLLVGCGQETNSEVQQDSGKEEKAKEVTKIRIGHTTVPSMLAVAKEEGFLDEEFSKDGIVIEYNKFLSGPPLNEAFAGERVDFGQVGDQPFIQAAANNIKVKAVGVYSSGSKSIGLIVPTGSEIKSFKELKGKKVGVTVGTVGHRLLNEYLKENGMTEKDIELVNLQPPDLKTTLEQKNIAAAVAYEPWISTIEHEGIGRQIDDAEGILNSYYLYVASETFAKEHPDLLKRLLNVLDKAEKWSQEHPDEAIEHISHFYGIDKEVLKLAVPRINFDIRLTDEAIEAIGKTKEALRENNIIRKDVDLNEIVDKSFLEELKIQ